MQTLVLASSSPYRRMLLDKLELPYQHASPDIDESPKPAEQPAALVKRLAIEKAQAIATQFDSAIIIGSDQVAVCDDVILGKPVTATKAHEQLKLLSGKRVTFLTGLAVMNTQHQTIDAIVEPFNVQFRTLSEQQIENYVAKEQPLNCAGSFKSEGLGIALFEKLEGDDPNSLIGLPLIQLTKMLLTQGIDVLSTQ